MSNLSRREFLKGGGLAGAGIWLGGLRVEDLLGTGNQKRSTSKLAVNRNVPTSSDDLAYLTIAEASELLARRRISPVDLVAACLSRIDKFDSTIKAWVALRSEQALEEAAQAERAIATGRRKSALHGIPIGHKDLYDVAGMQTTAGSKVLADAPPASTDATVVALMREAGAIVLGKTNTHEFAYGVWTPPTSNPWDRSRIPGGSSGGSAAAIASGMCLGATGSDTGGSIRIPSSLCNTVGIKATFGRVSKAGVIPLSWTLDHAGPIVRSVEDAALILNVIAGADGADPTTARAPVPDFASSLGKSPAGMVVGIPKTVFFEGADPDAVNLVRATIPVLEGLGVNVVEVSVPSTQRIAGTAFLTLVFSEALAAHETFLRKRPHLYQPQTQGLLALGSAWTAQHYLRAQRIRTINVREWVELFGGVDAVLTPTTPRPAPTKEEAEATGVFDLVNYTAFFDFNGCPSISVPCGFTSAGLPVGLMLSGPPFDEVRLLQLAYAYQQETRFHRQRPPLA